MDEIRYILAAAAVALAALTTSVQTVEEPPDTVTFVDYDGEVFQVEPYTVTAECGTVTIETTNRSSGQVYAVVHGVVTPTEEQDIILDYHIGTVHTLTWPADGQVWDWFAGASLADGHVVSERGTLDCG